MTLWMRKWNQVLKRWVYENWRVIPFGGIQLFTVWEYQSKQIELGSSRTALCVSSARCERWLLTPVAVDSALLTTCESVRSIVSLRVQDSLRTRVLSVFIYFPGNSDVWTVYRTHTRPDLYAKEKQTIHHMHLIAVTLSSQFCQIKGQYNV